MLPEHCPISILQAQGGGAIPGFALWTTERFVAVTALPFVDLPANGNAIAARGGAARRAAAAVATADSDAGALIPAGRIPSNAAHVTRDFGHTYT